MSEENGDRVLENEEFVNAILVIHKSVPSTVGQLL
jgi:hypothetical protein